MDDNDDMQGWAHQQELEHQQFIEECGGDPNSLRCNHETESYENIRGA